MAIDDPKLADLPAAPDSDPASGLCRACGATQALMDDFNARTYDVGGPWTWADGGRTMCRPCGEEEEEAKARAEVAGGHPCPTGTPRGGSGSPAAACRERRENGRDES